MGAFFAICAITAFFLYWIMMIAHFIFGFGSDY